MFNLIFHEYNLLPIEDTSSDLKFVVRYSPERKEHLCRIELSEKG